MKLGQYEVTLRRARPDDKNWVLSCWIDSLHDRHQAYTKRQCHALVNALYLMAPVDVQVAEVEGSPPFLVGFIVIIDDECIWLYVSKAFHGHGIAKALKEHA